MITDHNKRKTSKRPPMHFHAPAKPLFVVPTFNYL